MEALIRSQRPRQTVFYLVLVAIQVATAVTVLGGWGGQPTPQALWFLIAGASISSIGVGAAMIFAHRKADRSARRYRLLGELAAEVNRAVLLNQDEGHIFTKILDYAFLLVDNVKIGSVLVLDDRGDLVVAAARGLDEAYIQSFRVPFEESWQYRMTQGKITDVLIVPTEVIHETGHYRDLWTGQYRGVMSAPLYIGGKLYGLLNIDSHREGTFDAEDLDILKWFRAQIEVCLLARELYRTSLADSRVDGLTKFLSRSSFDDVFGQTLARAERYGEVFTVGMFDVDGLKAVNDSLGHPAGDRLLTAIADAIRQAARKTDVLGRYGGDEFVALFHSTDAKAMSERALRTLADLKANPPEHQGRTIAASFSFGFADFPTDGRTFDQLVAAADSKLYRVKGVHRRRKD